MRRLLVLRPQPGASSTVSRARERGLDAIAVPLFEIHPVAWQAREQAGFDALLLTSANAVRYAGEGLSAFRGLPVYAVGKATAEAAREAGFDIAATGEADVERLIGSIEPGLKLVHLGGADRRESEDARQQITAVTVYRSTPVAAPDLGSAAGSVALIHSPRAGQRFAELRPERRTIAIVAISPAAAGAAGSGWERVDTADQPSDDAMLALAERLCNIPAAQ